MRFNWHCFNSIPTKGYFLLELDGFLKKKHKIIISISCNEMVLNVC